VESVYGVYGYQVDAYNRIPSQGHGQTEHINQVVEAYLRIYVADADLPLLLKTKLNLGLFLEWQSAVKIQKF
jgi:hypothetical protein